MSASAKLGYRTPIGVREIGGEAISNMLDTTAKAGLV
jgi:hypothetical protein